MRVDYHVHAAAHGEYKYSQAWIDQYLERAWQMGIEEIGFSEHDEFTGLVDTDMIRQVQVGNRYGVKVKLGVEIDYMPGREEKIREMVSLTAYDFVIGSVHFIEGWGFDHPDFRSGFSERDVDDVYRQYAALLLKMVQTPVVDIVGHLDLVNQIDLILRYGERVALIGDNGSGKTTFIKTILGEISAVNGNFRLGSQVHVGYMSQEQSELDPDTNVLDTISKILSQNETENRSFLSKYLFKGDDVFKKVKKLSYGERARLSLACLVAQGCNFLILDEPINHLDIPSRTQFEKALSEFDGTILAVVHDRYFIEGFATQIWEVRDKKILTRDTL